MTKPSFTDFLNRAEATLLKNVAEALETAWQEGFDAGVERGRLESANTMAKDDPKGALLFVCVSVAIAFFLKNLFRYGAIYHQSQLRMAVVRDVRDALFTKALRLPP